MSNDARHYLILTVLFMGSLLLAVWPLPFTWMPYRPVFLALILCYLVVYRPDLINLYIIVIAGIIYDVFNGNAMGQQTLGFIVMAFGCTMLQQRIKMFAAIQQAGVIFLIVGLGQMAVNWVEALLYGQTIPKVFASVATTALLWPFCSPVLHVLLRRGWTATSDE